MKRLTFVVLLAACGDNSNECGPGTVAMGGICAPTQSSSICGDGTTLDPVSQTCVPDPTLCGSGTVLINGVCQDPTAGLTIDLEEGPEPNGFETDASSAGQIVLKPVGDPKGFVVHGCIKPITDTADLDNYRITVTAPTLIDVTADGVQGLAAGFVGFGEDPQLAHWARYGVNLQNDMSHRELYLPKAGTYEFVMADTRSLIGLLSGAGDVLEPAGNPDGTSCYYVTLNQLAIPGLANLSVPVGTTTTIDNKVLFYTGNLPSGAIDMQETINSPHAFPAFVIDVASNLHLDTNGEVAFAGVKSTDTTVIAIDFVYNYAFAPPDLLVSFAAATTAQALPTTNTSVTATSITQVGSSLNTTNQFYFDAPTDGAVIGMNVASTKPVQGVVWDADLNVVGNYGGLGARASWTSYNGLWRAPKAGRYYFALIDPVDGGGTQFTLTSTVTSLSPTPITVDTALTAQAPNAFNSNPYTLDPSQTPWVGLNASSSSTMTLLDPATAYGRLDVLLATTTSGLQQVQPDPAAIQKFVFPGQTGYVTKALMQPSILVKMNAAASFDLDVTTRTKTTLTGATQTLSAETAPANDAHRYYAAVPAGTKVTILAHPSTGTANPMIRTLLPNEGAWQTSTNTTAGADKTFSLTIGPTTYLAFEIYDFANAAITYDLTVTVTAPFYSVTPTTSAFIDACTGGTIIDQVNGLTDPQNTPVGFTFYGAGAAEYVISTNGYLSFDISNNGQATPHDLPDGSGEVNIAPLWEVLTDVVICKRIFGTKTIVEWSGLDNGTTAQFEALLDTADSSIEFVYSSVNQSTGANQLTVAGVQASGGAQATPTGETDFTPFYAFTTSRKLTHP